LPLRPLPEGGADFRLSLCQLLNPDVAADPRPLYHQIRSKDAVRWDAFLGAWVVTRYDDVIWVLRNLSAERTPSKDRLLEKGLIHFGPITSVMEKQMLLSDPPYHTRIRKLVGSAFTTEKIAALTELIREIARKLIANKLHAGGMEVMEDFADPFPAVVIAMVLGIPEENYRQLGIWAADFAETFGNFTHNPARTSAILQSCAEMTSYFRDCISTLRHAPNDGLVCSFMTTNVDGDTLTDDEIVANSIGILVGGYETAKNLIGTSVLTLLNHPEQMEMLRRDGALLAPAVEELLRYDSPVQLTGRIPVKDIELGGKQIRSGASVLAVLGAANCDPARFPNPDGLDLTRSDNRHVAFGWGPHFCIGAMLARLEMRVALECLLNLSNLQLARDGLAWRSHLLFRGPTTLRVTFDGASTGKRTTSVAGELECQYR
jgi:pimeloyl-[acyl-carrier protein] synthase